MTDIVHVESGELICGTTQAHCRCTLPPGHEPPHVCGAPSALTGQACGGSWTYDDDGELVVHAWPSGLSPADAVLIPFGLFPAPFSLFGGLFGGDW